MRVVMVILAGLCASAPALQAQTNSQPANSQPADRPSDFRMPSDTRVQSSATDTKGSPASSDFHRSSSTTSAPRKDVWRSEATRSLDAFGVTASELQAGSVQVLRGGSVETLSAENFTAAVKEKAVFVRREPVERIELTQSLREQLPANAQATAVKLGYTFTASQGPQAQPIRLSAVAGANIGLIFDSSRGAYSGGFEVALTNADDANDQRTLESPINILVRALGAAIQPTPVSISDVGRWHSVTVTVPNPVSPYMVRVSATPQDKGNEIELPISALPIQLIPASTHIIGWGIGQTPIAISVRGLQTPTSLTLALQTDRGTLNPSSVTLDNHGSASTTLRSDSAASTIIRVGNAGVASPSVTVTFDSPILFLIMAIVGGLFGAFLRGKGRDRWVSAIAIGVAAAILMTLAYAVGVDWATRVTGATHLASSGEAVVFVLGAVAALVGVSALLPPRPS